MIDGPLRLPNGAGRQALSTVKGADGCHEEELAIS